MAETDQGVATREAPSRTGRRALRLLIAVALPLVTAGTARAQIGAPVGGQAWNHTVSQLQVLVGRVFEDVDGDGSFGAGDRGLAGVTVITSTGQASTTDANGLYNIPSLSSGSVAISLDPGLVPKALTLAADGPGGGSWSRMLRTPIGGGAVLRQDFRLVARAMPAGTPANPPAPPPPAAPSQVPSFDVIGSYEDVGPQPTPVPIGEIDRVWPGNQQNLVGGAKPDQPPRRDHYSRQGPAMMIALGELAVGKAAPEFESFGKDGDTWGYGSVFYQGGLGSFKNRLTLSYDSRRRLNNTTGSDRLFELDPNDRVYPVMGDTSTRDEQAQSNSKLFARLERDDSYVMYGDLIGDLPESNDSGGRLSAYSRHLTGIEGRIGDGLSYLAVRGARPTTSYARDVFSGSDFGFITLSRPNVVAGTETVALEVRDRRAPERILSRQVLARGVDYRMEPVSGTLSLLRETGSLNGNLDLVQVVVTYDYQGTSAENVVASGSAFTGNGVFGVRASGFTEQPEAGNRFTVVGVDAVVILPRAGKVTVDVPYSQGTPDVSAAFDNTGSSAPGHADGFAISANVEQPIGSRVTMRASYLDADQDFANPFAATTTPGSRYGRAEAEFKPWTSSRLVVGATHERNETARVDNERNTVGAAWDQKIFRRISFGAGYAARRLDDNRVDTNTGSALLTGEVRYKRTRFEAMARREENVGTDDDPTYPTQTVLGARYVISSVTALVYSQRISDAPIRPIGDLAGFSSLDSTNELNIGIESRVRNASRLTSRYQVEGGINGPDAFAVIGAQNRFELRAGLFADLGAEHGKSVEGGGRDFTSGVAGLAWVEHDTFKTNVRYDLRDRDGFTSLFTSGAAGRIARGFTGLIRAQWLNDTREHAQNGYAVFAGLALRPTGGDAVGVLLSYRLNDSTHPLQRFATPSVHERESRVSTDGYWRPLGRLELYGKGGWQRLTVPLGGLETDTYLAQGRVQLSFSRWVDAAIENRYIVQPVTNSSRSTLAREIGVWPIADFRVGVGYSFRDTTDPFHRDRQGRPKGAYFTLSTKLAHLFDLLGSTPAPAAPKR